MGPVHPDQGSATNTGPMRRFVRPVALALALAAGASACATSSEYEWYDAKTDGVRSFFRVPKGWERFEVTDEPDPSRPEPIGGMALARNIVLDGSPTPTEDNFFIDVPDHPVGIFSVIELDPQVRGDRQLHDNMGLSLMRAISTGDEGLDPLSEWQNGNAAFELIRYREFTTESGMRGARITFNWLRAENAWVTIDQAVMVDPADTKLYRLFVKCESSCFKANQRQLTEILDSWQVRN